MYGLCVTATDTEAGKTLVVTALAAALARSAGVSVVKPVQTGCFRDARGAFTAPDVAFAQGFGVRARALHLYEPPCSPHLAADLAGERLDAKTLARETWAAAEESGCDFVLAEGAGGVYVPLNERGSMLDFFAELGWPVLLVVANRLGCLNHARLSLEALLSRGIPVVGTVLNRVTPPEVCDPGCGRGAVSADEARILNDNVTSLARLGEELGVPLLADIPYVSGLSEAGSQAEEPGAEAAPNEAEMRVVELFAPAAERLARLLPTFGEAGARARSIRERDLLAFDRDHLWHPYTSATRPLPVRLVDAAHDNRLVLADGRELVDGMSSWWCAVHGYGDPRLRRALTAQLNRMPHVMFGGLTHEPAVRLGQRLLEIVPRGMEYIFFADSGSVSVEVALKMAVQYQAAGGREKRQRFLTPMGGYHGDTQGAMSVCDPVNGMHTLFNGLLPRHLFVERPSCRFDAPFDPASVVPLEKALRAHADEVAAVVLEPVVQGAGGMWFYHPRYLDRVRVLCDEYDVLLVVDEIATGFGRTGRLWGMDWTESVADIMCIGKALTGGTMTGAATLATARVARTIGAAPSEQGGGLLMHGPTFMANPLFCAVSLASVNALLSSPWQERVALLEKTLRDGLSPLSHAKGVADVRVLGAIGVVETERPVDMGRLQDFFVEKGVWIRPFGRLVYVMPPFVTPKEDCVHLCDVVREAVERGLV